MIVAALIWERAPMTECQLVRRKIWRGNCTRNARLWCESPPVMPQGPAAEHASFGRADRTVWLVRLGFEGDAVAHRFESGDQAKRLRQLETDNGGLKKLVAEARAPQGALKELAEGNF